MEDINVTTNETNYFQFISMLIKLTQNKRIVWKFLSPRHDNPSFICDLDNQYLCIGIREFKITSPFDEERFEKEFGGNIFYKSFGVNYPYTERRTTLEITNEKGNLIWRIPYNNGMDDLYEIVQNSVADVNGIMNKIMSLGI
jgi:hypothetical protein